MKDSIGPLRVVIRVLRYQMAALVAASIIGGGPWAFNTNAATFPVMGKVGETRTTDLERRDDGNVKLSRELLRFWRFKYLFSTARVGNR